MATTQVVKVMVEELTKFGYKANGKFVNYSKQLSDQDKSLVVPGATFEAEYYIADSGKEYLNKVLNTPKSTATVIKSAPKQTVTSKVTLSNESPMTRTDWEAKDRRISRQGCIQAAVQSVAAFSGDVDGLFVHAEALANKMLEFVNR